MIVMSDSHRKERHKTEHFILFLRNNDCAIDLEDMQQRNSFLGALDGNSRRARQMHYFSLNRREEKSVQIVVRRLRNCCGVRLASIHCEQLMEFNNVMHRNKRAAWQTDAMKMSRKMESGRACKTAKRRSCTVWAAATTAEKSESMW